MSDFLSAITAPIAGDDPFGADVNHDADYERLKGEIGKLDGVDIDIVESLSYKILTEKSKDVRAMAFLAYAMLRQGDFERLADLFTALADYCADGFDDLFPRREGAKIAALRWFSEARFSNCAVNEPINSDIPHIDRLDAALMKLRSALEAKFSDSAPPLSAFYKRVAGWKKRSTNHSNINTLGDKNGNRDNHNKNINVDNLSQKITIEIPRDEFLNIYQHISALSQLLEKYV